MCPLSRKQGDIITGLPWATQSKNGVGFFTFFFFFLLGCHGLPSLKMGLVFFFFLSSPERNCKSCAILPA